jgi:Na+/proline symporter
LEVKTGILSLYKNGTLLYISSLSQLLFTFDHTIGFGITVMVAIAVFVLIGFSTVFFVKSKAENYFVGGRSLPLWVVIATLASQSLDSNAILGNVDLSYKYHFYDGAVLPIGLGLSLILNGLFLARHINNDGALTLPDVFSRRYGKIVEVLVSLSTIISFLCLLAGNLVGMGAIISYVVGISQSASIWLSAVLVLLYTIAGGLFSVAYTDVVQATVGWIGCVTFAFYMIRNSEDSAPPPSVGFPGYSYPNDEICTLYDGVPCTNLEGACCYNADKWCTDPSDAATCSKIDNGAYPIGDLPVIPAAMTDPLGLTPFPNAIVWNWATIFILGFGNLAALDFQARCMASKTPKIATIGCLVAGCVTFFVGIPFAYLGAITRTFYGPDTARASFLTDTCSRMLQLPTCALWQPDAQAFIKLLTHEAPSFLGAWCLVGIIAASMSTCDGAILAMGTVFSHNIVRNMSSFFPCFSDKLITHDNLLSVARFASIPLTIIATLVAAYYRSSHAAGATGYLLIVAFDIVFATCVVPLFGCFYTKKPSPLAALLSIISGALVRVILEFSLPKDGFLIAPFGGDEFLDYGPGASTAYPSFWDEEEADRWDSSAEQCEQTRLNDFTGVDSLAAPVVGLIVFVAVQFLERNGPIVDFNKDGNMIPYLKKGQGSDDDKDEMKIEKFEED